MITSSEANMEDSCPEGDNLGSSHSEGEHLGLPYWEQEDMKGTKINKQVIGS